MGDPPLQPIAAARWPHSEDLADALDIAAALLLPFGILSAFSLGLMGAVLAIAGSIVGALALHALGRILRSVEAIEATLRNRRAT